MIRDKRTRGVGGLKKIDINGVIGVSGRENLERRGGIWVERE